MTTKRTIRTIPQERTPVKEQPPLDRVHNFDEVNLGYTEAEAVRESERCLFCADPVCIAGCPVAIDIPGFILKIGERDFRGAYEVIAGTNLLPAICGRVCPQETQCEIVCTVAESLEPVAIGRLERFVGDRAIAEGWASVPHVEPNGLPGGHRRLRPGRHRLRRGPGQGRLRGDDLRGLPRARRRAALRHPGVPAAQRGHRRRDRQPAQAGRAIRVQHGRGAPVHHRADDRGAGLPRGVHRHRRRLRRACSASRASR